MPITKLQFEMGIDAGIEALMVSLYDFLEEHQDTAYAEEELYKQFGVSDPGTYIDTSHLDIALQKVVETGAVAVTRDFSELGEVTPEVRAAVAVNPDSDLIPVARANGILTAVVFPRGGLVAGRGSVIRLDGWTWEETVWK